MSQARLAEKAKCSHKYVVDIESGHKNISALILVGLTRGLGVTVGRLFETITPGTLSNGPVKKQPPLPRTRATRRPRLR